MHEPQQLRGGTPSTWDEFHLRNANSLQALSSAPERAILVAAISDLLVEPGDRVLELGCGASRFLPRIALETGAAVAGVDFSEVGIGQTRAILRSMQVDDTHVVQGRIEDFVLAHPREFDAVVSFGLVEHFDDLDAIVGCHVACARPGARVFISAPNLAGVNLRWLRLVAPSLLEWHRPLGPRDVVAACARAGARSISSRYLGGPRLFAPPEDRRGLSRALTPTAVAIRKVFNGMAEGLSLSSPRAAEAVARHCCAGYFAVTALAPEDLQEFAS